MLSLLALLPDQLGRFRSAASDVERWDPLFELAGAHGVDGVLHDALLTVSANEVRLRSVLQCQEEHRVFERVRAAHQARVLHEVLTALDEAQVGAVSLKGPVLGERLYPANSLRPSTDIDLLFAPAELARAVEALERIGYRADERESGALRPYAHHLELHRAGSPAVEAHFRLHSEFGIEVPAEPFLARSLEYRTRSGAPTRVLAPEDELLHLALHASAHRLVRVGWLFDLKLLIVKNPTMAWDLAHERAKDAGALSAVAFALTAARDALSAAVPDALTLRATDPRHLLAGVLASRWAALEGPVAVQRLTSFAFATILCDHPAQSIRSMGHLFRRFGARQADAILRVLRR